MRILLRRDEKNNAYVWCDATYKNERYYRTIDGTETEVYETNIVAVEGHTSANYVVCCCCGEVIPNTPEEIEKHYKKMEDEKDCTQCRYLSFDSFLNNKKRQLVDLGDGRYDVTETFTSSLYCNANYSRRRVEEVNLRNSCVFYRCRQQGVRPPRDIFAVYPDAFDKAITVDALVDANGKPLKFDGLDDGYFLYDMKSRGTIKACVNPLGIVECFRVSSNGNQIYFYYSEKYDRVFMASRWDRNYMSSMPYWFREAKYEEALKRIRALYEGANKDE